MNSKQALTSPVCPCDSGKMLQMCCGPFLDGKAYPRTVRQLMRSRYSAFALGGFGDYLLASWHPDTSAHISSTDLDSSDQRWQSLQILDHEQLGDRGRVEFKATYLDPEGVRHIQHENSAFLRVKGRWVYLDGRFKDSVSN